MNVEGGGAINNFYYKYNDKNQIIEVIDLETKFFLTYNADGTLEKLEQTDSIVKKGLYLFIIYKKQELT